MEKNKILNRNGNYTEELTNLVNCTYKGFNLEYFEFYYLDYKVCSETGIINKTELDKFYSKKQVEQNLNALKNALYIAKKEQP